MKPDYKELLKEKREKKFEILEEVIEDENWCNHSPGPDGCIACTHPSFCIFSEKRIKYDDKLTELQLKKKDLEKYIRTGEGTYGYDKNSLRVELYKTKKEIQRIKKELEIC